MKITGIVTDVVKHTDRHNVATLFTREQGRMSFITHGGGGKRGASRMAMLMPLSVIGADIRSDATRELQILTNASRLTVWHDIYFNPVKSALAMFLAEFLNAYLRFSDPDPALWDFAADAIYRLDRTKKGAANIHLGFLAGMLPLAGISPDLSDIGFYPERDWWFDMREGCLTSLPPLHGDYVRPEFSRLLPLLARMSPRTAPLFRFNAPQRRDLLDGLLKYYAIHCPGLGQLKSPSVLRNIFSPPENQNKP